MKKKTLRTACAIVAFMLIFSLDGVAAVIDDEITQSTDEEKTELVDIDDVTVIEVTESDAELSLSTNNSSSSIALTPIEEATSVASGLIASGSTDKSVVIATLVSAGFEQTEAEIAYAKASTNNVLDDPTTITVSAVSSESDTEAIISDVDDEEVDTSDIDGATVDEETVVAAVTTSAPETAPSDRVAQTVKPSSKFKNKSGLFSKSISESTAEVTTAKSMVDEGYTVEQIVEGFADNGYSTDTISSILNKSGVSAEDAYEALSNHLTETGSSKPSKKFVKRFGAESAEDKAAQDQVKTVVNTLESAGYEVQDVLDTAVQDLKDAGMTAVEIKDYLNEKVADGKPKSKFKTVTSLKNLVNKVGSFTNKFTSSRPLKMTSYGDGETALASAMLKAGFSSETVESAFKSGNQIYTNEDAATIVSSAQYQNTQSTNVTNITDSTQQQIEQDINNRTTDPTKI